MTKRKINFLILLILGLLCLTGSILAVIKDLNINLIEAKYVIGLVSYADTRNIENFTLRRTSHKRVFYFKLNNSNEKFAIHRSSEDYEDLVSKIKPGVKVKVYYRPGMSEYNTHVFQVEKGDRILASYDAYNKKVSVETAVAIFVGVFLTIGSIMWYKKISLPRFLNGLVDGKKK